MQNSAPRDAPTIVVLGVGGTIAGTAGDAADVVNYAAGRLRAADLVASLPALAAWRLQTEEIARIDSKDIDFAVWLRLATSVAYHLDRSDVAGVVVSHGSDTLEETAYLLQRVLAPDKPVVLTAAMRPATALSGDGPRNLLDAVRVAALEGARGVVTVLAGTLHGAFEVRKRHPWRLDAFDSGDAGPLGAIDDGAVTLWRPWPHGTPLGLEMLKRCGTHPPRVCIVTSHGDADGSVVEALRARGVDGIVAAGTGNGTLHARLEAALAEAEEQGGVRVLRCTRLGGGRVIATAGDRFEGAGALTPGQARIELLLRLLQEAAAGPAPA